MEFIASNIQDSHCRESNWTSVQEPFFKLFLWQQLQLCNYIAHITHRFQAVFCTINRTLVNKSRKQKKIYRLKSSSKPRLRWYLCIETKGWWMPRKMIVIFKQQKLGSWERVKSFTSGYLITNDNVWMELNAYVLKERLATYKEKWKQHMNRMKYERLCRKILNYDPREEIFIGQPQKWWLSKLDRHMPNLHSVEREDSYCCSDHKCIISFSIKGSEQNTK